MQFLLMLLMGVCEVGEGFFLVLNVPVNGFSVMLGQFPGLICLFGLMFYVPVYCHNETLSSPNHTFIFASSTKLLTSTSYT